MTSYILLPLAPGVYTAIVNEMVTFEPGGDTEQRVPFNTTSDSAVEATQRFMGELTTSDAQVTIFEDTADVNILDTGGI